MNQSDKPMGLVLKPLREALRTENITEDYIIQKLKSVIEGDNQSAKMRAIEILSKWAGWQQPEKHIVKHETISIVDAPDDLDV